MYQAQQTLEREFGKQRTRWIEDWKALLRFPSISADPARSRDCAACARWLTSHISDMGFTARLARTPAMPVVLAERQGAAGKPVVLFYGHYDVQPADPLDLWHSPPFEPVLKRGRLYARGAADNKGQLLYVLKAIETLLRLRAPLPTIKIVIEGEEECGSVGIADFLRKSARRVRADVLMVTDTDMSPNGNPAIVMGLRGILHLTARLDGPSRDLHSGVHGGVAPNPAQGMASLIAGLHRPDGSINVAGFCDGIRTPSARERAIAAREPVRPAAYRRETGVLPVGGEEGFTAVERAGFRPTIEVNGVHSGYGGEGQKTIIPATAFAKLTARLVPGQNPGKCLRAIMKHLRRNTPRGLRISFSDCGVSGGGFKLDPDSAVARRARRILKDVTGRAPVFLWHGASVPIVAELARVSGAEPLLAGFGLDEDRIHAPDESFSLEQFRLGYLYAAALLQDLALQ